MTNKDILNIALEQSAVDCSCKAGDFLKDENTLVESRAQPGARRYLELPHVCNFVYYGHGVVACAGREYMTAAGSCLELFNAGGAAYRLFETPNMHIIDELFSPLCAQTCFMAEYFLPDTGRIGKAECPFVTRLLHAEDFSNLYTPEWSHALSFERPELDVLGVGAYHNGRLIGLAACSADCDTMWQIGVDVLPDYRGRGVASCLTSMLAREIIKRGKVPFYCAAWSNIRSVRNAISSGFRPAWVELTVKKRETVDGMNRELLKE